MNSKASIAQIPRFCSIDNTYDKFVFPYKKNKENGKILEL